jgi:hypothetical protein
METVAQLLLGLILWANVLAYMKGGRAAVGTWWHSKLVGS